MRAHRRFLGMSMCLATLVLSGLAPRAPLAQPQCPDGYSPCLTDTVWLCVSAGTQCGRPDSGSVESWRDGSLERMKIYLSTSSEDDATVTSARMSVSATKGGNAGEGMLAATIGPPDDPHGSVKMIRKQIRDQWKWIVSTVSLGTPNAAGPSVRFLASGKLVYSAGASKRDGPIAEIPELPSHLTLGTSAKGTTMTWGFAQPVRVRVLAGSARPGAAITVDAIEFSTTAIAPSGLGEVELQGEGIGTLQLGRFALTRTRGVGAPKTGTRD